MVAIEQRIVPVGNRRSIYRGTNRRTTLTVHQTGNTARGANADMHAWLQHRGYARASWHYQSDDHRIIQSFPTTVQTWHAGDGRGNGNLHSISWEICINRDGDYLKSLQVASEGIAKVLKQHNLKVSDLRQHYDWSRKNCPAQIRASKDGVNWTQFKAMVQKAYDGKAVSKPVKPDSSAKADGHLTLEQVAEKAYKGGYGNQPWRENNIRNKTFFSYEEVQPLVNRLARGQNVSVSKPKALTFDEVVNKAIDGDYGSGDERKRRIPAETEFKYQPVQDEINRRLLGRAPAKPKPQKISFAEVVRKTRAGDYGNMPERKARVEATGHNYEKVQNEINRLEGGGSSSSSRSFGRGDRVRATRLYGTSGSTKPSRTTPISGYIETVNTGWRNPYRLEKTKGKKDWLGFARRSDLTR